MPPDPPGHPSPPGRPDSRPRLAPAERAARVRFRRAIALMLMTLVAPGSAQLVAGNRRVGRVALRVWLGLLAAAGAALGLGMLWNGFIFWLVSDTGALGLLRLLLVVVALGWAALFLDAWRLANPLSLGQHQRLAVVGVNGVLCLGVAGSLLFGAHLVTVQRDLVTSMFGDGAASEASGGRYNVLLLGGDSGAGRVGLRPDSLTVASIDAETGQTVLVGLARNMANFPFREGSVMDEHFPDGFDCDACYLFGVSTWAEDRTELFKRPGRAGVDATVMAVEGITGLDISYSVMVNMQGFKDLVDAVGGVELTVRQPIPIGLPTDDFYSHIPVGTRTLDGFETLWFARARHDSDDYSRMARQKCVMGALAQQVSPQQAVRNFRAIAEAGSAMVTTDLPAGELDTFIDLALKSRSQPMSTVSLVPPAVNTGDPDIGEVHDLVSGAIEKAEDRQDADSGDGQQAAPKKRRAPESTTGGSIGSRDQGYAANQADDLATAC